MLAAVGTAVQRFMETHDLVKKGTEIKREDIREGLTAVLSVCVREPQFQGQTKGRLNNPEVGPRSSRWLARARKLPAQEQERGRRDRQPRDPGGQGPRGQPRRRLAGAPQDRHQRPAQSSRQARRLRQHRPRESRSCSSSRATVREGRPSRDATATSRRFSRSAARSRMPSRRARPRSWTTRSSPIMISALGCGMDDHFDPARLRYGKVILLTDADSDGHHIATLLLTFFYRHVPGLFADGRVYLACPPLLQDRWGKETFWASDDAAPRPDPRQAPQERQAQHHAVQGTGRDAGEAAVRDHSQPRAAAGSSALSSTRMIAPTPIGPSAT